MAAALTSRTIISLNSLRQTSLQHSPGFSLPQDMTHLPALPDADKVPVLSLAACALASTDSCLWLVHSGSSEFQSAGGLFRYSHTLLPRAPCSLASRRSFSLAITDSCSSIKKTQTQYNTLKKKKRKWRYPLTVTGEDYSTMVMLNN